MDLDTFKINIFGRKPRRVKARSHVDAVQWTLIDGNCNAYALNAQIMIMVYKNEDTMSYNAMKFQTRIHCF